jgi:hypothetical protein
MAYLVREFQKSLNGGKGVQDSAVRNKEGSLNSNVIKDMLKLDLGKS